MEFELSGCEKLYIKQTDHQFAWIFKQQDVHNNDSLLSLQNMTEGKLQGWRRARYYTTVNKVKKSEVRMTGATARVQWGGNQTSCV